MTSTYVNDLRLNEMATGDASGSWGTVTNTNLELIGEALGYGTEAITTNADTHTSTIADGATDPIRAIFIKYTGTLDSACTITIGPNTVNKFCFIHNATSGSQSIIISQGSGANVTIATGQTKGVYLDGAGSGAAVIDAFAALSVVDLLVDDDLTVTDDMTVGGVSSFADGSTSAPSITNTGDLDTGIAFPAADSFAISTAGTQRLLINSAGFFDVAATGNDVARFSGANSGSLVIRNDTANQVIMHTSTSDALVLGTGGNNDRLTIDAAGAATFSGTLGVTGVLTTTAATVFNGGFASNAASTIATTDNSVNLTLTSTDADASGGPKMNFYRNSSSPAAGDILTQINHQGENDAGETVSYMYQNWRAAAVGDGAESGQFDINTYSAGTAYERLGIDPTETVFNQDSADIDFRVESDNNAYAFFVNGENGDVGINSTAEGGYRLDIIDSSNASLMRLYAADGSNTARADIDFWYVDSGGSGYNNAQISTLAATTAGNGSLIFSTRPQSGSLTNRLKIDANGSAQFGEIQEQTAGTDISLTMVSEDSGLAIMCRSATDGHTPYLQFQKTPATSGNYTATGVGDFLGVINFNGVNTSGGSNAGGYIEVKQTGTDGTTVPASMNFHTNSVQRMTILSSGTVLISKTSSDGAIQGHELRINDFAIHTVNNGPALYARRIGAGANDDGDIQIFQNNDGTVGSIGSTGGDIFIGNGDVTLSFNDGADLIAPTGTGAATRDNAIALGNGGNRFDDAFITNGVTTGSDRTEKQDIAALTSTEMLVAARISQTFHTYRWKDAVADKGDDARIHTGTIAQEVQAAFTAESLDAGNYAMFMSDTWWEHYVDVAAVEADDTVDPAIEAKDAYTRTYQYDTEDEAPSGSTSRTRLGIRYPELLSFLAAYNEQRFSAIETRLTALEA